MVEAEGIEQLKIELLELADKLQQKVKQVPETQLYAAAAVVILTPLLSLLVRLFKRKKLNTIVLAGVSGSGKTVLFYQEIVEPFTTHYVFALGVARFLSCAHWVLQVLDIRGRMLTTLGYGLWPSTVLLSEIVQTFILDDFCHYYVKSVFGGQLVLRLPS